jgi:hypothetical protein
LDVTQENARVVGDDEALTRVCAFAGGDTGAARRGAEHQMVSSNKKPTKPTNIPERTYGNEFHCPRAMTSAIFQIRKVDPAQFRLFSEQ